MQIPLHRGDDHFRWWTSWPIRAPARTGGQPPCRGRSIAPRSAAAPSVGPTRAAGLVVGRRRTSNDSGASTRHATVVTGAGCEALPGRRHLHRHRDRSGVVELMVDGSSLVLANAGRDDPGLALVVTELGSEGEAQAMFRVVRQRMVLVAPSFDARNHELLRGNCSCP
jgi:hypothetical protein